MTQLSGREREVRVIRQANRAATVGRLMLGKINSWEEFLEVDTIDLKRLPRRNLKSALSDIRGRLSLEIKEFSSKNFQGMDESKLSLLYEDIKAYRGLELPLVEFEKRFAAIKRDVIKGNPSHLTICLSLWGLQFKFPEDELAKDLVTALQIIAITQKELAMRETRRHSELEIRREEIADLVRRNKLAIRSAVICCFNLIEAYLNALAWDYVQKHGTAHLSNNQKKLLDGSSSISTREKLRKYPQVLTGNELWKEPDEELNDFIDTIKPFRDSLVHASPFSTPEKFGGYDKLRLFYRLDHETAFKTANLLIHIIQKIHRHIHPDIKVFPKWISQLEDGIKKSQAQ